MTGYFTPSAKHLLGKMKKLFDAKIEYADYYKTMPHVQPGVDIDWIVFTDDGNLFLEVRNKDIVFVKNIPIELRDTALHHARSRTRLFTGPLELPDDCCNPLKGTNVVRFPINRNR